MEGCIEEHSYIKILTWVIVIKMFRSSSVVLAEARARVKVTPPAFFASIQ